MFLSRRAHRFRSRRQRRAFAQLRADPLNRCRVGYIPILGAAPLFVADKEGFAKAAGLDFRMTVLNPGRT